MITPVRIPETPVILHKPPAVEEETVSVSVDTDNNESLRQKTCSPSISPTGSIKTVPSHQDDGETLKDVPVATLVTTA